MPRDNIGGRFEIDIESSSNLDPKSFVVRGQVRQDGHPVSNIVVVAIDKDLRSEELLGQAMTDEQGRYVITYTADQFRRAEKGRADLIVRAQDSAGKLLVASPTMFNAPAEAIVDLVVANGDARGPSEYEQRVADLTPLLQGLSFAELTEDDKNQDVTFLSAEMSQDPVSITFLIAAHRLFKETNLPAEAFYGLFRQGLPTRLPALLAQSQDVQRRALVRSAEANIIQPSFAAEADAIVREMKKLVVREAVKPTPSGGNDTATLNDLLSVSLKEPNLREEFLGAYVNHSGPIKEFWTTLAAHPEFKDHIEEIQHTLQLGTLTGNHLPLVRELRRMQQVGEITMLSDLARFDEDGWLKIISKNGGISRIGFQPGVPGKDDGEKSRNYAKAMSHMVEDAFPTNFVARRLETDNLPGTDDLLVFFNSATDFDLRSTRLDSYLQSNPRPIENLKDAEGTRSRIKALQRVYKLAPRYTQTSALIKGGVDSAHAIARMGENVFLSTYGDALGGTAQTKTIYARSQQVEAVVLHLAVEFGISRNKAPSQAAPNEPSRELEGTRTLSASSTPTSVAPVEALLNVEGAPEWSTLFGSIELCECEECRSVYSPAAYLVDALHFLKDRPSKLKATNTKDILFLRRPDLGEIELTCENTNTPLPYVDLVNEALENAVAPFEAFTPFDLPGTVEAALNKRTLSDDLRKAFKPALSTEAVITVGAEGQPWDVHPDWWTIDEPRFNLHYPQGEREADRRGA